MNIKNFLALIHKFDRQVWISLAIAGLGLLSLAAGSYLLYRTQFGDMQSSYLPVDSAWQEHFKDVVAVAQKIQKQTSEASGSGKPQKVTVDIGGAVEHPGTYTLESPARVQDVVLMAGGFLSQASKKYIHQELNLASVMLDQSKLYIPLEGESSSPSVPSQSIESSVAKTVNTASQSDLDAIDDIGAKRAETIIAGRPYKNNDDFRARSGISTALADAVLELYPL